MRWHSRGDSDYPMGQAQSTGTVEATVITALFAFTHLVCLGDIRQY